MNRIALIPGDGIGGEVLAAGVRVLDALGDFEYTEFPWGSAYYAEHGRMLAEDGLEQLAGFDAIYFGAVGWPGGARPRRRLWGLRLAICQGFDQYANVRPVQVYEGAPSVARTAAAGLGRACARTARASTPGSVGATSRRAGRAMRSRCRRRCSPRRAASGSCGSRSISRGRGDAKGHERHQEQRPAVRDGAVGRGVRARGARLPGRRDRALAGRRDGRAVRAQAGDARRGRRVEPVRRHPVRPRQRAGRQPRPGGERQPQPGAALPEHVRAGARLGAGHRRRGDRQPDRRDLAAPRCMLDHLGLDGGPVREAIAATIKAGILTPDLGGTASTGEVTDAILAAL